MKECVSGQRRHPVATVRKTMSESACTAFASLFAATPARDDLGISWHGTPSRIRLQRRPLRREVPDEAVLERARRGVRQEESRGTDALSGEV
jgi:hypothetical protein